MFLAKRISGVFFFGTPQKGSSLASWSTMTARLLKTASLGANTNTQLSKDLEPNSKRMANISEAFLKRCSSLKIISCYETLKMDYLNTLVGGLTPNLSVAFATKVPTFHEKKGSPLSSSGLVVWQMTLKRPSFWNQTIS